MKQSPVGSAVLLGGSMESAGDHIKTDLGITIGNHDS